MAASARTCTRLVLSESGDELGHGAPWIGPLLALGTRSSRYAPTLADRQLVIAVSVPKRDFAAVLIGCGWVLASESPKLPDPLDTLRALEPGQPVRFVNNRWVITAHFSSLDEASDPPRAQFTNQVWRGRVDGIRALAAMDALEHPETEPRPEPRSLERMARMDLNWDSRLVLPAADLALVGTVAWLEQDFDAYLTKEDDTFAPPSIRSLLKPKMAKTATWFTRVFASGVLVNHLPLPKDLTAVVLDGSGAIKYLGEIEARVVFCVLDRSVADESAGELVAQLRNTRGEPISLSEDLGWSPPAGVEALAFTVAL